MLETLNLLSTTKARPGSEWRRGWKVLLAATIGYGSGTALFCMTAGLFVRPMQKDFGWSTSAVSIAPIVILINSVFNPIAGVLADKWGSRHVAALGIIVLAVGVIALAMSPPSVLFLYTVAAAIGVIAPLSSLAPFFKGTAGWFNVSAGAAFGIVSSGTSLISVAAVPIVSLFIFNWGWRVGYLALVGIMLGFAFPFVLLWFKDRPGDAIPGTHAQTAEGCSISEALRQRRFWVLFCAIALVSIPIGGFMTNLQPLLGYKGFGMAAAAALGVIYSIAVSLGRIGGGLLIDRLGGRSVATCMMFAAALGALVIGQITPSSSLVLIATVVTLIGMGHGTEANLMAYFPLKLFGMRAYSTIVGTVGMACGLGMAVGGMGFAASYDHTGSYAQAAEVSTVCYAVSGLMLICLGPLRTATASMPRNGTTEEH
jgi:nitrate/nitrite transporter NarK